MPYEYPHVQSNGTMGFDSDRRANLPNINQSLLIPTGAASHNLRRAALVAERSNGKDYPGFVS